MLHQFAWLLNMSFSMCTPITLPFLQYLQLTMIDIAELGLPRNKHSKAVLKHYIQLITDLRKTFILLCLTFE